MMLEIEIVFQSIYHRFLNIKENIFQVRDSLRLVRDSQSRNPKRYFSESRTCGFVDV